MSTDTAGALDLDIDAAPYDSETERVTFQAPPRPNRPKKERKRPKGVPGTNRRHAPVRTLANALARRIHASSACAYEASIISSLDRRMVPGLGTFAVEFVGARPTLYFDPDFMETISDHELDVTLKHEVMHLTLHHPVRGSMLRRRFNFDSADKREKALQQQAHGLAADWAVNELLIIDEPAMAHENKIIGYWALPREHMLPPKLSYEEYFPMALELLREKREQREKEQAEAAAQKIAIQMVVMFLQGAAAEGDMPSEQGGEPGDAGGVVIVVPGSPNAGTGEEPAEAKGRPRPRNLDELLEAAAAIAELVAEEERQAAEASKILGQEDDTSEQTLDAVLSNLPSRDPLPSAGELEAITSSVLQAADRLVTSWGKSAPNVFHKTKVRLPPEPLRGSEGLIEALRAFMPSNLSAGSATSMRSISRPAAARARYYRNLGGAHATLARRTPLFPGVAPLAETLTVAIPLDTSGSMTESMLSYALGVIRDVLEELGITEGVLLECDDRAVRVLRIERGMELPEEVIGRGGTDFDPGLRGAVEWARENGVVLDAIIYVTDGHANRPQVQVDVPTIWARVGKGSKAVLEGVPGNLNVILEEDL
jgi:predicted metal-dependent peptidase